MFPFLVGSLTRLCAIGFGLLWVTIAKTLTIGSSGFPVGCILVLKGPIRLVEMK